MLKVSNMTVGDLKEVLEQFADDRELICCLDDRVPLDISSITFTSYDPDGSVELDHINGSLLCVCLNLVPLNVGE